MPDSSVRHTLGLALRLIDTTAGHSVFGGVKALKNGTPLSARINPEGQLLFLNLIREDFLLTVTAPGFEPAEINVKYAELDSKLPIIEAHLIPGEGYFPEFPCFTLRGEMPGITEIDGVKIMNQNLCFIQEFDPRKRLLTVLNPYNQQLDRVYYAALNAENESFEPFIIEKQNSETVIKIKKPLERPSEQTQLAPRVIGKAENGGYLLRVRDDSSGARWIIRFKAEGTEYFQTVDFAGPDPPVLNRKAGERSG